MLKYNKRKSTKPKKLSPEKVTKDASQASIDNYFSTTVVIDSENLIFAEGSLPSPDDAALPCATTSCFTTTVLKGGNNVKIDNSSNGIKVHEINISEEKKDKKTKSTNNDVSKKKKPSQFRNTQLTEFFPVRRSNRKTLNTVMMEKHKNIENAILSGNEDQYEVREFPGKGRGVVTTKPLKRGEFVLEYYGELIDSEEAAQRERLYSMKENTGCYMYYFKFKNKRYCIDATKESGRLGRLVNHSKKGNLKTQPIFLQECPHLALFAGRDIEAGEELTYDYGDRSKKALEYHPWLAL